MKIKPIGTVLILSACVAASFSSAQAGLVLDGSGFGAPSATITYDPNALESNFGAPGSTTTGAAYDIYTRADATYAYVLVSQNGGGGSPAGAFANLYFGTGATAMSGSDVGFEVTNSDVFAPGVAGSKSTTGTGIQFAVLGGGAQILSLPCLSLISRPILKALGFRRRMPQTRT